MAKKEFRSEKCKNKYEHDKKQAIKELKEVKKPILHQEHYNKFDNKEITVIKPVDLK